MVCTVRARHERSQSISGDRCCACYGLVLADPLTRRADATVLGIAGPSNHGWLAGHDAVAVHYGDDLSVRLRAEAPSGRFNGLLYFFGYVAVATDDGGTMPTV